MLWSLGEQGSLAKIINRVFQSMLGGESVDIGQQFFSAEMCEDIVDLAVVGSLRVFYCR